MPPHTDVTFVLEEAPASERFTRIFAGKHVVFDENSDLRHIQVRIGRRFVAGKRLSAGVDPVVHIVR